MERAGITNIVATNLPSEITEGGLFVSSHLITKLVMPLWFCTDSKIEVA